MLTGGGDCPGLNAVIRAAVRKGSETYGHEFIGFRDGWKGPLENLTKPSRACTARWPRWRTSTPGSGKGSYARPASSQGHDGPAGGRASSPGSRGASVLSLSSRLSPRASIRAGTITCMSPRRPRRG